MNQSSQDKNIEALALLSHPDFHAIESAINSSRVLSPKLRERYQLILFYEQSPSISQISQLLQMDRKTVRKWLVRFQQYGLDGLNDKPRSGRKGAIDEGTKALILKTLHSEVPSHFKSKEWTVKSLAEYLDLPYHPVLRFIKGIQADKDEAKTRAMLALGAKLQKAKPRKPKAKPRSKAKQ